LPISSDSADAEASSTSSTLLAFSSITEPSRIMDDEKMAIQVR